MLRLADIRIRSKLIVLFILAGSIPLLTVGLIASNLASDSLMEKSFNQLITVQTIRKTQIEDFFSQCFANVRILASSSRMDDLVSTLDQYLAEGDGQGLDTRSPKYQSMVKPYLNPLKRQIEGYGFEDLFLIDIHEGKVLFSLAGSEEVGTSLRHGQYRESGLAIAWRQALESGKTSIADFQAYAPRGGQQCTFIAQDIRNNNGQVTGVIALEMTDQQVTRAVDSTKGMGQTGESYLLGVSQNNSRFELRSNLKTMGEGKYVVGYSLEPLQYWLDTVRDGQAGGHGTYVDSAGHRVLVAYDQLTIAGLNWYLISKIDWHEVTAPVRRMHMYILVSAAVLLILICAGALYLSRTLTLPIFRDMEFAEAIARGELDATLELDQKDELGDLAIALNSMARNLQDLDWLQRGKEGLDDDLRGEHEADELARRLVSFMSKHLGAQLGAIYLRSEDELVLKASWSFFDRQGNFNRFNLGEGMVGQAALENQIIVFSKVREDAPALNYGAGEQIPAHFMAIPITLEERVMAVLLLGSIEPFSLLQRGFIEQNRENVAILLNAASSRQMIRELLDQAQAHQEKLRVTNEELQEQARALRESEAELQAQQEELRVTNEELEEQTKALKESEAELQAQQEELRVTNEELEERTRALEEQTQTIGQKNADLVKAQNIVRQKARDLEQASKYKSEFLANMSHELRTPLNSILILSQLFGSNKEGNLTPKQIESAGAIHSSGAELLELINEILDLSKVEAGKMELNIEEVFIENVVADLERMFKDMAEKKGLRFTTAIAEDLPRSLLTDNQRLQQILRNLLSNAFKFTAQGEVAVTISRPEPSLLVGTGLSSQGSIAFAVRDEGIGIAQEQQEAIFSAFQQADGSTSRVYGGTGLGLSISKQLSALLGGIIRLVSREGEGSTFTIVLPEIFTEPAREGILPKDLLPGESAPASEMAESTAQTPAQQEPASPEAAVQKDDDFVACTWAPETGAGSDGQPTPPPCRSAYLDDDRESVTPKSRSLLIIEDDRSFAQVLRDFGRERGFLCLVAEDGETGLHFADYYQPSAVILDIGLPGIDGWTVMERLKENPKLRHIPVHFMSADDKSLDALKMGAIGFLSKPVSVEKVEGAFAKLEAIIAKPVSRLLVVEDDKTQRDSIVQLVGGRDVETTAVGSGQDALKLLERENFDCMVLDLGLEDMSGFDLLEKIRHSTKASKVPVIIYTGRDLTKEEERKLKAYAESIIIKGVKSPERLLDESALFLHRLEADLPVEQKKMLKLVHDKEAILSGKRILLVDDDMRNVFALTSVLEDSSMEVVVAKNGVECLEKMKEEGESIDCILMDIMMPQMDGYDAMRRIRKERKYAKLPIIAITAKAMKGDREKCIEAGASDYLAKPVNTDKLLSMMKVWLY